MASGTLIRCIVGGLIGGVIGALVWGGIAYATGYEVGFVAWGIGGLVGFAVLVATGEEADPTTGLIAAGISLLAIAGGKYGAVNGWVNHGIAEARQTIAADNAEILTDEYMMSFIADEVAEEYEQRGRAVNWPATLGPDEAPSREADYPADVWREARFRWENHLTDEDKQARRDQILAAQETAIAGVAARLRARGFWGSWGMFDLIFGGLAVATAFKVGSGLTQE